MDLYLKFILKNMSARYKKSFASKTEVFYEAWYFYAMRKHSEDFKIADIPSRTFLYSFKYS